MDETEETGIAFRAGIKGLPFIQHAGPQPDFVVKSDMEEGPNERYLIDLFTEAGRIPGLSDPEAAYETGRALRWIGFELDRSVKAPIEMGAMKFVPILANAVLYFSLRNERQPWGAADTAFIYADILVSSGTDKALAAEVERAIIRYAKQRPIMGRKWP